MAYRESYEAVQLLTVGIVYENSGSIIHREAAAFGCEVACYQPFAGWLLTGRLDGHAVA
jgi:hypothetical protein